MTAEQRKKAIEAFVAKNGTRGVAVVKTLAAAEASMRSGGRRVALASAA